MIKFTAIEARDTFAYEHMRFEFDAGIHSIVGVNGASKSSLILALCQGLFNRNPKGGKVDQVNNYITGRPYEITVDFTKGADEYRVINSRKAGSIKIYRNGKDVSPKRIPAALKLIEEILGTTYETFVSLVYQSNKSTLDLVEEAGDSARKAFISRILKFAELDKHLDKMKAEAKSLKQEINSKEELITTLEASIITLQPIPDEIPVSAFEYKITKLTAAQSELSDQEVAARTELAQLTRDKEQMVAAQEVQERMRKIEEALGKFPCDLPDAGKAAQDYEEISLAHTCAVSELRKAEGEYRKIRNNPPVTECPTCHQALDHAKASEVYDETVERLKVDIETAKPLCATLDKRRADADAIVKKHAKKATLERELQLLNDNPLSRLDVNNDEEGVQKAQQKLELITSDKLTLAAELSEVIKCLTNAKENNTIRRTREEINREATKCNKAANDSMLEAGVALKEADQRLDLVTRWIEVLGSSGYRVTKMAQFLNLLNASMAKYSNMVSGGAITCTFYVDDVGKIQFSVVDADKAINYCMWSDGEKSRVKLACLFAVLEILEVVGDSSFNILCLDEVFAALDAEGREGLFRVLDHLRGKGKSIYTVAHSPIANAVMFDTVIQATKKAGLASITVGGSHGTVDQEEKAV